MISFISLILRNKGKLHNDKWKSKSFVFKSLYSITLIFLSKFNNNFTSLELTTKVIFFVNFNNSITNLDNDNIVAEDATREQK